MGRAAGAVLTAVAPEARVASKAAAAGRRPPVADPRVAAPGSKAARQREDIERIKAARAPDPAPVESTPASPPPASPGGGLPSLPVPAAAATGSGFLLGVFVWALGLAYLREGGDGVRKFMAAKFFNKTEGGGA
jgi:hypothetical protein